MEHWKRRQPSFEVTAAHPCTVFLVKSLLFPVVAVLTLCGCLWLESEPIGGPYILIAVLAFFGAADFMEVTTAQNRHSQPLAVRSLLDIILRWLVVIGFIWILMRIAGLAELFNSHALLAWALATPPIFWVAQLGAQWLLLRSGGPAAAPKKAVIVGVTELGGRLDKVLADDQLLHTEVVGFFEDRKPERVSGRGADRILGRMADLPQFIVQNAVSVVYITLPMNRDPRVLALLEALRDSTVSIYFVPDLFVFNLVQARFDLVHGIPLVAVCESPFYGIDGMAKRLTDMLVAASLIVLISPLLLAVALGVRLSSPGPVLFKQKRYGLNGKPITVYKFRSMSVTEDGEHHYTQVARGDARVTPFGAFIRKTSLDELPQLFNVLEGSMSIVGPRPHAVLVNEQYRRLIPGYMVRHKVKPGITGWAQINGYRGGDDLQSMQKRIEFDLEYLRNWSWWFDLVILFRTAAVVWKDKGAY
jgi:putative colanic acid biosysnthesis UDP-glucose lipid carrier transferase